jgi:hypothetical protein
MIRFGPESCHNLSTWTQVLPPFGKGGQGGFQGMAARQIPPHPPLRKGGTNMQKFLFRYLEAALQREWLETHGLGDFAASKVLGLTHRAA